MKPELNHSTASKQPDNTYKIKLSGPQDMIGASFFIGDSPDRFNKINSSKIVKNKNTAFISGLEPDKRYYFKIVLESGLNIITATRRIHLDGAVNFRDLGGYTTTTGQKVKWGQVFRSDSLARLSEKDNTRLRHLDLKTIVDFRSHEEVEKMPDRLPDLTALKYVQLPIFRTGLNPVASFEKMKAGDISWLSRDFIIRGYINSVEKFPDVWGRVINDLVVPKNRPLVFHCTAGKDRTGVCAALILRAIHVSEETVIYDHGLSNKYIAKVVEKMYKRIESFGIAPEKVEPYFTAVRESIVALIDHIRKTYGSVQNYLIKRAGITEKTLALLEEELLQ